MTLVEIYAQSGETEKLARAMELSREAVSLGRQWLVQEPSQEAENLLAQSYGTSSNLNHNLGTHENLIRALRFCRMASRIFQRLLASGYEGDCRANLACTFFNMGAILCDMGGQRNLRKAKLWLEKGLKLDEELRQRSRTWRREDNYAATNLKLGDVCRELGGGEKLEEAAECYRRAVRLGNLDACFSLGCMYEEGLGVDSDKKKALRYLNKAAAGGHMDATRHLKSMAADGLCCAKEINPL
jgi:tetratricopeptide (TPR) repeat protein